MFYPSKTEKHSQRLHRARPVIALASVAFAIGAIFGANHTSSAGPSLAGRFVHAWTRGDFQAMYSEIDGASRQETSVSQFAEVYAKALTTATATSELMAGKPREIGGGEVEVPVSVHTRLFGTLSLAFEMKILEGDGEGARVEWSHSLAFPGLRPGEQLS